jgi:hypothetical protein
MDVTEVARTINRTVRGTYRQLTSETNIDRPIFLVGLQGGGLTLIRRILTRAPNMVTVGGNSRLWYGSDEMQNRLSLVLPEEFRLLNCQFFNQEGFHRGAWVYGTDNYIDHFRKTDKDVTPELKETYVSILRKTIAQNAISINDCRFIDKSQTFGLKIKFLTKILEDYNPKFLIIAMNPYVACHKATQKPALSLFNMSDEEKLKLAAQHYYNCMTTMLNDGAETNNTHLITFESFLEDPEESIKNCCSFLELEYSKKMLPSPGDKHPGGYKWYPIRKNVNSEILEKISDNDIEIINAQLSSLIQKLGYQSL